MNLIIEINSDIHEIQINRLLVYFQGCTKDLHHEIKSLDRSLIMLVGSIYFSYILRERVGTRTMCNKTTSVEYILLLGCFCSNEANKNVWWEYRSWCNEPCHFNSFHTKYTIRNSIGKDDWTVYCRCEWYRRLNYTSIALPCYLVWLRIKDHSFLFVWHVQYSSFSFLFEPFFHFLCALMKVIILG